MLVMLKQFLLKIGSQSFYNYEYYLDVSRQNKIYPETISLEDGLRDSVKWYLEHSTEVNKKPYFKYINENLVED